MLKSARTYFKNLAQRYIAADIPNTSAALAFHTLLGLVPALALIIWYLRELGITRSLRAQVRQYILDQLNLGAGEELFKGIERLSTTVVSHSLDYLILFVLFYTVFNLTRRCGEGLDRVLDIDHTPMTLRKALIVLNFRRAFVVFTLPLFLLASLVVSSWLKQDSWLRLLFDHQTVGPILARPIPWLIDIFAIFVMYLFIPKKDIGVKHAFMASCISGPLFELSKILMAAYSKNAISVLKIYGALATVPLFIIWIQVSWIIILSGPLFIDFSKYKKKLPKHEA